MLFRFGNFLFIAEQRMLFDGHDRIPLASRTSAILLLLLENAGRIVSREVFCQTVWGVDDVDDTEVSRSLSLLQSKLKPYYGETEVIETRTTGYIFMMPVMSILGNEELLASSPEKQVAKMYATHPGLVPIAVSKSQWNCFRDGRRELTIGILFSLIATCVLSVYHAKSASSQPYGLAVLAFRDPTRSADASSMGVALQESFSAGLSRDRGIESVGADEVAEGEKDLGLSPAHRLEPLELHSLEKRLGVAALLTGTYVQLGEQVKLDIVLHNGNEVVSEFSETVRQQDLQATVERVNAMLRVTLHLPPAQTVGELHYFGQDQPALRFYAEGLRLSHTDNTSRLVIEAFGRAVHFDPQFAEAHEALADAWSKIDHTEEAREEARLALGTCGLLPETRRLSVQASAFRQLRNYPEALRLLRQLRKLHPDDQTYKARMADALISVNKDAAALALFREMEADKSQALHLKSLGSLLVVLSTRGAIKGDFIYPERIMKLAQAQGSRSVEAMAHISNGILWRDEGEGVKAVAEFQRAEDLLGQIHDESGVAHTLVDESLTRRQLQMPWPGK